MNSASQVDADAAIRDLLFAALKPDSSVFTDHVAHLCQAYSLLGGMESATGRDADLRDTLYRALAACARQAMPGTRKSPGTTRELPAESLRDLCDGAQRLMGS